MSVLPTALGAQTQEPGRPIEDIPFAVAKPLKALSGREWGIFIRLSLMMLIEFIVFGAWFATLGLVLATHHLAGIIGWAYSLAAIAAILSPLLLGSIGDRFIASEKVFATAHVIGAVTLFLLAYTVRAAAPWLTLALILINMLAFMPTLGLVNTIALRTLKANAIHFPYIRIFAPGGWFVAGVIVGALGLSASVHVFTVAGIAGAILALYALSLPTVPPHARGTSVRFGDLIGRDAFVLFRDRNFTALMICAFLTSISLGIYNAFTSPFLGALGETNVAGVMAIGQISEVVFIATIPFALRLIGMKWMLMAGMGMWGIRFLFFAFASQGHDWAAVVGVGLHGICNDFFIVVAAMFIDRLAPAHLAAQAQSWLILMISGFGALAGSVLAGWIFATDVTPHLAEGPSAWSALWVYPIGVAAVTVVLWALFFRTERSEETSGKAGRSAG